MPGIINGRAMSLACSWGSGQLRRHADGKAILWDACITWDICNHARRAWAWYKIFRAGNTLTRQLDRN